MPKALIIGSGLGGLSTALRLVTQGYEVEVVEKYHQPGGRLNQMKKDGFTFDVGPSFFSMSYEFDELFRSCGIPNPLQYEELDPVYSVNFSGRKEPYLIYKQLDKLAKEFESVEPLFRERIEKYLAKAGEIFHDTEDRIIRRNFNGKLDYLRQMMKVPFKHIPYLIRSMWDNLDDHFTSQEAKVVFSLVAFFLGSTPFQTPAVYSLLNYTELVHDGYWHVKGGMYSIVQEMMKLLEARGVKFHFNTEITGYHNLNGSVNTFQDQNGRNWTADVFVVNADAAAFRGKVLGQQKYKEEKLDKMEWTLAPFTMYLGVDTKIPGLVHHNYFLGNNFNDYASKIFSSSISPEKPYYYVNMSSYSNPACAPEGCENIFILCPVPDLRFKSDWSDKETLAKNILDDFSSRVGVDIAKHIKVKEIWSPIDWEKRFNLYRGSGLGLAHGMKQIGALRPANFDEKFNNVFYVGASTIPGTGLPIVVMSSKLVTERILQYGPLV